jgi:cytochrome c oxidase subunit 2
MSALQSALAPAGPEAAAIAAMTWVLVAGAATIFVAVMGLAAWALVSPPAWLRGRGLVIGGGIVFPLIALSALLVYTLLTSPRLAAATAPDLVVEVTGEQWWWRVHYLDREGTLDFATANEIRIPAGAVVELRLRSADVLHSFWVPALAGKLDLVPGKDNRLRLVADRPGRYRGQCAEYCGGPHGLMAFHVVALAPAEFEAWRTAQRRPRSGSGGPAEGRRLFLAHCASCHTVRGTPAAGGRGPDLTHLAGRDTLGAGLLPNNAGALAGWIASSQQLKPGNLMPEFRQFSGEELSALAAWLAARD